MNIRLRVGLLIAALFLGGCRSPETIAQPPEAPTDLVEPSEVTQQTLPVASEDSSSEDLSGAPGESSPGFEVRAIALERRADALIQTGAWSELPNTNGQIRYAVGDDNARYGYLTALDDPFRVDAVAVFYAVEWVDGGTSFSYGGGPPVWAAAMAAPDDDSAADWINAVGDGLLPSIGALDDVPREYEVEGYVSVTARLDLETPGFLLVYRPYLSDPVDINQFNGLMSTSETPSADTSPAGTDEIVTPGVLSVGTDIDAGIYRTERTRGFCVVRALTSYSGDYREQWAFEEGAVGVIEILDSDLAFENSSSCGIWKRVQ